MSFLLIGTIDKIMSKDNAKESRSQTMQKQEILPSNAKVEQKIIRYCCEPWLVYDALRLYDMNQTSLSLFFLLGCIMFMEMYHVSEATYETFVVISEALPT